MPNLPIEKLFRLKSRGGPSVATLQSPARWRQDLVSSTKSCAKLTVCLPTVPARRQNSHPAPHFSQQAGQANMQN